MSNIFFERRKQKKRERERESRSEWVEGGLQELNERRERKKCKNHLDTQSQKFLRATLAIVACVKACTQTSKYSIVSALHTNLVTRETR